MSQRSVERVIGRLVTDEAFRRKFAERPERALRETVDCGLELTPCEIQALAALDVRVVERFAEAIDPRSQTLPRRAEAVTEPVLDMFGRGRAIGREIRLDGLGTRLV